MAAKIKQSLLKNRTLSRDLMMGLAFLTWLVLTLSGVLYQVYYAVSEKKKLNQTAEVVSKDIAEVLSLPLWNMDMDTVTHITNAYLAADFLIGARISSDVDIFLDRMGSARKTNTIIIQKDILKNGKKIGTLELCFTKKRITAARNRAIVISFVTIILVTSVIGAGIKILMKNLLTRPLDHLTEGLRTIADGNYTLSLPYVPQTDINKLITEVNTMAGEVSKREADLIRLRGILRNIIDSMPSILVGVNKKGRITLWNREAEDVTGITAENARGRILTKVYPQLAEEMNKVQEAIKQKTPLKDARVAWKTKNETRFTDITVYPLVTNGVEGAVIRVDDITERIKIEEMMIQSEKMLSVGGLAAGMAHEINNPLAGIMQNIQVIQSRFSPHMQKNQDAAALSGTGMDAINQYMSRRGIYEMMSAILVAGKRAARIVENMLSFSRKSESVFATHDINVLLDKTLELAENDYDLKKNYDFRKIQIIREYDKNLNEIPCEASKLQQVFLNIFKNGAQAMMEQSNDDAYKPAFTLRTVDDHKMVRIEIKDNGPGIEESIRKRIFEPFFTTKKVGVGTGLGLSVSYFIITENHDGEMTVESKPSNGTCFIIRLPVERPIKLPFVLPTRGGID